MSSKTIGLALGGGGARGCAHIGVIKALQEEGIKINYVAGTSIGALVGGVLAAGNIDELEKHLLKIKWNDVITYFDPVIPKRGLFEGKKVVNLLRKLILKPDIKKFDIPYIAVATDLNSGEEIHFDKGDAVNAIRASIAIPGILTPYKYGQKYLIDGGVVNPLPVNVVKKMGADIVIAVDLNHYFIKEKLKSKRSYGKQKHKWMQWLAPTRPNLIDVIEGSVFMMEDKLSEKNLEIHPPEFLIQPELGSASIFDFHKAKKMINEGYEKTKKQIPAIKRMLNR